MPGPDLEVRPARQVYLAACVLKVLSTDGDPVAPWRLSTPGLPKSGRDAPTMRMTCAVCWVSHPRAMKTATRTR